MFLHGLDPILTLREVVSGTAFYTPVPTHKRRSRTFTRGGAQHYAIISAKKSDSYCLIYAICLGETQTSIDGNHLSGHPFGFRIGEPDDPTDHIIRIAAPLERDALAFLFLDDRSLFL
jgi:hypothetical protein